MIKQAVVLNFGKYCNCAFHVVRTARYRSIGASHGWISQLLTQVFLRDKQATWPEV